MDFNKRTEAEIQFELGRKILNIDPLLEVYFERSFALENFKKTRRSGKTAQIRVDIVVVRDKTIKCVIEVKNYPNKSSTMTRQSLKYKELGYPYCFCWNENYIDETIKFVRETAL